MQQVQYGYVMGNSMDPQFAAPHYGHPAPVPASSARGDRKKKEKSSRAKATEKRASGGGGVQRKVSNPEFAANAGADGTATSTPFRTISNKFS